MGKLTSQLWKGPWSSLTAYTIGDFVSISGSTYVCIANNTNQTPPNATYWILVAQAGTNGIDGTVTLNTAQILTNKDLSDSSNAFPTSIVKKTTAQVLTNKDLTDPSNTLPTTTIIAPEGFLINGQIVTSITTNNLTVAIKTLAGTDPTVGNPVLVRIGNTIRTISAALSVTKNAGTNWCNSGGGELATLESDYFVYLGYNATDGVVLGFSRVPTGRVYSDFSVTTTDSKYTAISTITHAASTDQYENIGRFNAILSATASFNWSLPTTSIIINRPIFETRWLPYTPGWTGFSANPTSITARFKITGSICNVALSTGSPGTSNSTSFWVSLPFAAGQAMNVAGFIDALDNGGHLPDPGIAQTGAGSTQLVLFTNTNDTSWTGSGGKATNFTISYEI